MKKENKNQHHDNPVASFFVSVFYDFLKNAVNDFHIKPRKKNDEYMEHLSTIEHLSLKLEKQIQENRHLISSLQEKVFWSNLIIIVLLVTIFIQLVIN